MSLAESHDLNQQGLPQCGYGPFEQSSYPSEQLFLRLYFILPAISFGLAANIVNITVFVHPSMRKSTTNWFLLALTVADTILLLSGFNMFILPVIVESSDGFIVHLMAQYLMRWSYPVSQLTQTASVYSVVAVTFHRFLGICHPFVAQRYCTARSIKLVIGATILFSFLFTLPRWTGIILVECYSQMYNRTGFCMMPGSLYRSSLYSVTYSVAGYIVVMFLLPFLTLCVLDIQLIRAVKQSVELQKRTASNYLDLQMNNSCSNAGGGEDSPTSTVFLQSMLPTFGGGHLSSSENLNLLKGSYCSKAHHTVAATTLHHSILTREHEKKRGSQHRYTSEASPHMPNAVKFQTKRARTMSLGVNSNGGKPSNSGHNITMMLISIVTLFLLCNILPFLNNILEHFMPPWSRAFRILVELGNFLVTCNSSAYAFIYYFFNSKYRATLCQLFFGCCHNNIPRQPPKSGGVYHKNHQQPNVSSCHRRTTIIGNSPSKAKSTPATAAAGNDDVPKRKIRVIRRSYTSGSLGLQTVLTRVHEADAADHSSATTAEKLRNYRLRQPSAPHILDQSQQIVVIADRV